MDSQTPQLNEIAKSLREGKPVMSTTVRDFLWWFGAQRRTFNNRAYIDQELEAAGLVTQPSYLEQWIDNPISFALVRSIEEDASSALGHKDESNAQSENSSSNTETKTAETQDYSYKIGKLQAANRTPVSVKPNSSLQEAFTLMLAMNFSQLPVMTNEREVKGVISWASIGSRYANRLEGNDVQFYMDDHQEISANASIFSAISTITEHNYVLVRGPDRRITGIVTAADLSLQFESMSTPFLLLSEIEMSLRMLIESKMTSEEIGEKCGPEIPPEGYKTVSDLSFGHYVRLLENPDAWSKIGLHLDRKSFCSELDRVRLIRNDVMHFDPDPITSEDLEKLRNMSRLLDHLRSIGAFNS